MTEYTIADGGAGDWVIPLITLLGVWLVYMGYVKRHSRKEMYTSGISGVLVIALTLYFYIQPTTSVQLDSAGMRVVNPWFNEPTLSIHYSQIAGYGVYPLHELGGARPLSRTNGYSDGSVRQGWFRTADGREAYLFASGDRVLAVEVAGGGLFMLAPDNFHSFVSDFEERLRLSK